MVNTSPEAEGVGVCPQASAEAARPAARTAASGASRLTGKQNPELQMVVLAKVVFLNSR
jgi:hypothetical protein